MIESYTAFNGTERKWRYADDERPRTADGEFSAQCYDCGRPYKSAGDCSVSDKVWEMINPTFHRGAGILCASCIVDRLHEIGVSNVKATLW